MSVVSFPLLGGVCLGKFNLFGKLAPRKEEIALAYRDCIGQAGKPRP